MSKVKVFRAAPRSVKKKAPAGRAPAPLSGRQKASFFAIAKKKAEAKKKAAYTAPVPVKAVVLSPIKPRQQKCALSLWTQKGSFRTSYYGAGPAITVDTTGDGMTGGIRLWFEPLTKGKLYALDCAVSAEAAAWEFSGEVQGVTEVQAGHLLAAFIPSWNGSSFQVQPRTKDGAPAKGTLFYCELTRVD